MRIGVVPVVKTGGVYQYSMTMLRALEELAAEGSDDEFLAFVEEMHHPYAAGLRTRGWATRSIDPPLPSRRVWKRRILSRAGQTMGEGRLRDGWRWVRRRVGRAPGQNKANLPDPDAVRYRPEVSRWFHQCGVELMLYPSPRALAFEARIPYVMAIHDLQHRLQPEFPEVSANGEWEWREYLFRNGARFATLLLVDSEVGKEDVLDFYGVHGVEPDRVKVLPFLPASYLAVEVSEGERLRLRTTYRLPERYVFYPAQFWPHKNHASIVRALGLLKQEHRLRIPVAFCGSYAGEIRYRTFRDIMALARQLGIEDQLHYLGYVPDEDMSGLYAGADALVMPTFFGPTNIPVLEAWALGCPAITSDIRGIREHAGDAAILIDPHSAEAIANGIYRLWTDAKLRGTLAERGKQRLAAYTPEHYSRCLAAILDEAKDRVRSESFAQRSSSQLETGL